MEEIENHWSLSNANCGHWFLRLRWAACLHSLSIEDGNGEEIWGLESMVVEGDDGSESRVSIVESTVAKRISAENCYLWLRFCELRKMEPWGAARAWEYGCVAADGDGDGAREAKRCWLRWCKMARTFYM